MRLVIRYALVQELEVEADSHAEAKAHYMNLANGNPRMSRYPIGIHEVEPEAAICLPHLTSVA